MQEGLQDIYNWARSQLDEPILLGYRLHKVNGQMPGCVLLLVRQAGARLPEAEIQIDYTPNQVTSYRTSFKYLPFTQTPMDIPRPEKLRLNFVSQQAVIHWLKTGRVLQ